MTPAEVHSQVIGCTVQLENSQIVAVVTAITTGDVPQLFVRHANGITAWVEARHWTVVRMLADPAKAAAQIQRQTMCAVPEIPYATSSK